MKKTKFLMLAFALLTFTMMGCSLLGGGEDSKEEEEKKKDIKYETFEGTNYKEKGTITVNDTEFKIVLFGDWPQTIKDKDVKIDESTGAKAGAFTYFKGSDDAWYYEAKESAPMWLLTPNKYSDGTTVNQGKDTKKWFKVEPIRWRVLTTKDNKSLLLSQTILTNCAFYEYRVDRTINGKTIKAQNYEYSRIRAFLNGTTYQKQEKADSALVTEECFKDKGFLQTAFAGVKADNIIESEVKDDELNSVPDGWTGQKNTSITNSTVTDKIFLLSSYEVTHMDYGFVWTSSVSRDTALLRKPTDYAKANGVFINEGRKGSNWWLRTPSSGIATYDYDVEACSDDYVGFEAVDDSLNGVVPALWVKN